MMYALQHLCSNITTPVNKTHNIESQYSGVDDFGSSGENSLGLLNVSVDSWSYLGVPAILIVATIARHWPDLSSDYCPTSLTLDYTIN